MWRWVPVQGSLPSMILPKVLELHQIITGCRVSRCVKKAKCAAMHHKRAFCYSSAVSWDLTEMLIDALGSDYDDYFANLGMSSWGHTKACNMSRCFLLYFRIETLILWPAKYKGFYKKVDPCCLNLNKNLQILRQNHLQLECEVSYECNLWAHFW